MLLTLFMTKTKGVPLPQSKVEDSRCDKWSGAGGKGRGGGGKYQEVGNRSKWWLWIPHNWNIPLHSTPFHSSVTSSLGPSLPAPTL